MNAASPLKPLLPRDSAVRAPRRLLRGHPRRGAWATLAQSSLCLLTLMASTSCLVTSTPDFTPPDRTPPFLVTASADPDPRGVLLVNTLEQQNNLTFTFSADVISEDQGAKVYGHLYIDYGRFEDQPALDVITEIPPRPEHDVRHEPAHQGQVERREKLHQEQLPHGDAHRLARVRQRNQLPGLP